MRSKWYEFDIVFCYVRKKEKEEELRKVMCERGRERGGGNVQCILWEPENNHVKQFVGRVFETKFQQSSPGVKGQTFVLKRAKYSSSRPCSFMSWGLCLLACLLACLLCRIEYNFHSRWFSHWTVPLLATSYRLSFSSLSPFKRI